MPRAQRRGSGRATREIAAEYLELVGLGGKAGERSDLLGVYDRKSLMLGTALATRASAILLDEPFGGLSPAEIDQTIELIGAVRARGLAVVCIEHVMRALTAVADRVMVMHHGAVLFQGTPAADAGRPAGHRGLPGLAAPQGRRRRGRLEPRRQPMLQVCELRAGYLDTTVIRDLSLTVAAGEVAVLIGPNGHGKTTLLRAISGLITPSGRPGAAGRGGRGRARPPSGSPPWAWSTCPRATGCSPR